jgi:hypothetical protein
MVLLWRFFGARRLLVLFVVRRLWRLMQSRRAANQPR